MDEQTREEGRATELKRQELGARLVDREVMCCATGQSISMDGVIQDIVMELWGDQK